MKLDNQHTKAIELLSEGITAPEVAKQLGVSKPTVYRWLNAPVFQAELIKYRQAQRAGVVARLHREANVAVDVIMSLLVNERVSPYVRLEAAREILNRVMGQVELDELNERINELERLTNEQNT